MRTGGGAGTTALMTIERVAVLQRVGIFAEVPGHMLVAVARLLEEVPVEIDRHDVGGRLHFVDELLRKLHDPTR